MIKVTKPTNEQLSENAKKMNAAQQKMKERMDNIKKK